MSVAYARFACGTVHHVLYMSDDGLLQPALVPGTVPAALQVAPPSRDLFHIMPPEEVPYAAKTEFPRAEIVGIGPGLSHVNEPKGETLFQTLPPLVLRETSML